MNEEQSEFEGACHCGTVTFRVSLANGLKTARRCDCSFCRMRGAVVVTATLENFHITGGEEALTLYQFNTLTAKHFFCSRCGIYTHHQRRSDPYQLGLNASCLSGLSPFDFQEIPVNDGVNHPSDRQGQGQGQGGSEIVGVLRFVPQGENGK